MRRAALSEVGGKGRLHVRLVALFSIIASVPTLLVVIFASMLFQSGVKFWFSDQAQDRSRERRECLADLRARASGARQARRAGHGRATSSPASTSSASKARRFGTISSIRRQRGSSPKPLSWRSIRTAEVSSEIEVNFDDRPLARPVSGGDAAVDAGRRDPHEPRPAIGSRPSSGSTRRCRSISTAPAS